MLEQAQRPLDALQGRFEGATPVDTRLARFARFAQQLERVSQVFARCLERVPDPSPGGSSTSVQRAPALRTTPPVDYTAPLLGGSGEGAAAGSLAPINAAAPVDEQSAGHRAGS